MIYNGPSIYNQGGGGGGYKDGGALVDGDFIEVTNNSISTYDNTSRDPINFYFEVKDGEVLNAVVELTTVVNATVKIYILNNGLYYPLGNVGGDAVTAGNDYKINITGDSFSIELVTGITNYPEYINIDGYVFGVKKINGYLWTTDNLKLGDDFGVWVDQYGMRYYQYSEHLDNLNVNGFVVPDQDAFNDLMIGNNRNAIASTDMWLNTPGNNSSGFNAKPYGYKNENNIFEGYKTEAYFAISGNAPPKSRMFGVLESNTSISLSVRGYKTVRLCKKL